MDSRYYIPSPRLTSIINNAVNPRHQQQPYTSFPAVVNNRPPWMNNSQSQFQQVRHINQYHQKQTYSRQQPAQPMVKKPPLEDDIYKLDDESPTDNNDDDDLLAEIELKPEAKKLLEENRLKKKALPKLTEDEKVINENDDNEVERTPIDLIKSSLYFQTLVEKKPIKSKKTDINTAFEIDEVKPTITVKSKGNIIQFKALSNATLSTISTSDSSNFKTIKKVKPKSLKSKRETNDKTYNTSENIRKEVEAFEMPPNRQRNQQMRDEIPYNSKLRDESPYRRRSPRPYRKRDNSDDDTEIFSRIYNEGADVSKKKVESPVERSSSRKKERRHRGRSTHSYSRSPSLDSKRRYKNRSRERERRKRDNSRHRSRSKSPNAERVRRSHRHEGGTPDHQRHKRSSSRNRSRSGSRGRRHRSKTNARHSTKSIEREVNERTLPRPRSKSPIGLKARTDLVPTYADDVLKAELKNDVPLNSERLYNDPLYMDHLPPPRDVLLPPRDVLPPRDDLLPPHYIPPPLHDHPYRYPPPPVDRYTRDPFLYPRDRFIDPHDRLLDPIARPRDPFIDERLIDPRDPVMLERHRPIPPPRDMLYDRDRHLFNREPPLRREDEFIPESSLSWRSRSHPPLNPLPHSIRVPERDYLRRGLPPAGRSYPEMQVFDYSHSSLKPDNENILPVSMAPVSRAPVSMAPASRAPVSSPTIPHTDVSTNDSLTREKRDEPPQFVNNVVDKGCTPDIGVVIPQNLKSSNIAHGEDMDLAD